MAKTYLEFVNAAISEAKVSLDPLDALNFANPPRTILYNKFKDWVNRSYKELLLKRNEWHYQKERTITSVGPRIQVVSTGYVPQVGDVLRGQVSQFEVTITAYETFEDDLVNPGISEFTLDITLPEGNRVADFAVPEVIDVVGPVAQPNAFIFQGPGFYAGRTPTFQVDSYKATIFDPLTDITAPGTNIPSARPLICIPWDQWTAWQFTWTNTGDMPQYITQNPMGLFDLYPRPVEVHPVEIYYTRGPAPLVDYDDQLLGFPEQYEDYILWKTVEEFADYDQNTRLFARANKKVEFYENLLERDEMPKVKFAPNRFYQRRYP